jgi:phosphatidylglycerol---prolipoprotein diacylglyceryl transferase
LIPPYDGPLALTLGPLHFPLFGLLVVTGVFVGHAIVLRLAAERRISLDVMRDAAAWAVGAGFVGAHLVDVLFYHPERLERDGLLALVRIWDGISSYGGFLGALVGVGFFFRRRRERWWTHADLLVQGLVAGWVFGRLGCTLTSDHLGRLTSFALAFSYAGGARHNVGFYELLLTLFVLVPAIFVVRRAEKRDGYRPGIYVAVLVALYAPARFALDFLRATDIAAPDPRWLGLTTAQYFSIAAFAFAVYALRSNRQTPDATLSRP